MISHFLIIYSNLLNKKLLIILVDLVALLSISIARFSPTEPDAFAFGCRVGTKNH